MKKYALIVILLLISQSLISETLFVKGKVLNFREEPNGKKIGVLYSGTEIEQVYNKGKWARVKVYGWVYKPLTESKEAKNLQKSEKKTEKSVYKTTMWDCYLYSKPTTNSKTVGSLDSGESLLVLKTKIITSNGISMPFYYVETQTGEKGWVSDADLERN